MNISLAKKHVKNNILIGYFSEKKAIRSFIYCNRIRENCYCRAGFDYAYCSFEYCKTKNVPACK